MDGAPGERRTDRQTGRGPRPTTDAARADRRAARLAAACELGAGRQQVAGDQTDRWTVIRAAEGRVGASATVFVAETTFGRSHDRPTDGDRVRNHFRGANCWRRSGRSQSNSICGLDFRRQRWPTINGGVG